MNVINSSWNIATDTDKHGIMTGRILAFLDAIICTLMSLAIKKINGLSSANILLIRCLSAFVIVKVWMDRTGTTEWAKTPFDKNTFMARAVIGGVGTIVSTLAIKFTDIHIFSVIVATGAPITVLFSRLAGVP